MAESLGVTWPDWYGPFVLELAGAYTDDKPFWLPGGFIFASLRRAYDETIAFRAGERFFTGAPSPHHAGPGWPPCPLPHHYVVIGATGGGPVLLDTRPEAPPLLLSLSNEGYFDPPLIDFQALNQTPLELAREIIHRHTR